MSPDCVISDAILGARLGLLVFEMRAADFLIPFFGATMQVTKIMKILFVPALTFLVATGAHAEAYDGVHNALSAKTRDEVNGLAVQTASAPNQNVVRGSRGPETMAVSKDRSIVEAEAIRAAWAPDQNVGSGSRVNSKVISTMPHPADVRAKAN